MEKAQITNKSRSESIGVLQRACTCGQHTSSNGGECEECKRKRLGTLQRSATNTASLSDVPPIVYEVIRSTGQPLDAQTRGFMEPRFGNDFSGVRIHTDPKAAESAQSVDALAYTVGKDIVFGDGKFQPQTQIGRRLIAHELTHVVQAGNQDFGIKNSLEVGAISSAAEEEAERIAHQINGGFTQRNSSLGTLSVSLRRQIDPEIDWSVEQGIIEETESTSRPSPRPRLSTPPSHGQGEAARQVFNGLRDDFATRLGVPSGGQVHHAIELQVLDRYPGVFSAAELNDFDNMRGIGTELQSRRQLHNSKIREFWNRHYRMLESEIASRNLQRGTEAYNTYVRRYLTMARDEIDYLLEQFFTEFRSGRRGARVRGGGAPHGSGSIEPQQGTAPRSTPVHPEELHRTSREVSQAAQVAEREAVESVEQRIMTHGAGSGAAQITTRSFLRERFPRIIAASLTRIAASRAARRAASLIPVLGWVFAGVDAYNGLRDIFRGNVGRGLAGIGCAAGDVAADVLHVGDAISGVGGTVLSLAVQAGTTACQVAIEMSRMRDLMNELEAEIQRIDGLPSDQRLRDYYELDGDAIRELRNSFQGGPSASMHTQSAPRSAQTETLGRITDIEDRSRALVWSEEGLLELNRERDRLASEL